MANSIRKLHSGFIDGKIKKRWAIVKLNLKKPQIEELQTLLGRTETSLVVKQSRVNKYACCGCHHLNYLLIRESLRSTFLFSAIKLDISNLALNLAGATATREFLDSDGSKDIALGETFPEVNYVRDMGLGSDVTEVLVLMRMRRGNTLGEVTYRRKISKHFQTYFGIVVVAMEVKSIQKPESPGAGNAVRKCESYEWIVKILPNSTLGGFLD